MLFKNIKKERQAMKEINFTINLENECHNFNQFEAELIKGVREKISEQIVQFLEEWDQELGIRLRQHYPQYRHKGYIHRQVRCYFGTIWIKMRRYVHKGWLDVYPLLFILPDDGISEEIMDLMMELVTDVPYQKTNRYLKKATGVEISSQTIWRRVQRLGRAERDQQEQIRCKIFEEGGDDYCQDYRQLPACQSGGKESDLAAPVYIELDGTMVGSREVGEDRFEIKSGIMYSQVVQMGEKRRRLMDKVAYGSVSDSETFGENFYAFCRENGLDLRREILFLSDGAQWLNSVAEDVFPEAKKRLDLYHLKKACGIVLDEQELNTLSQAVYYETGEEIIRLVQNLCNKKNLSGKSVDELMQYLVNNRKAIDYPPGERHGSGGIEKNIGILVGRRFKRQGMSWSHEGANNLLALRAKKLNQIWQQESQALNYTR
jgi:hypothetical protein